MEKYRGLPLREAVSCSAQPICSVMIIKELYGKDESPDVAARVEKSDSYLHWFLEFTRSSLTVLIYRTLHESYDVIALSPKQDWIACVEIITRIQSMRCIFED
jgi:hypothetical protein